MELYSFSWLDFFPYLLVLFLLLSVSKSNKSNRLKSQYAFYIIFIFSAIRYGVGFDYYTYQSMVFGDVDDFLVESLEPLSLLLIRFASKTHFQILFVASSFVTFYPIYRICRKYSINPAYSLLILYLMPFIYFECISAIRNAMAYGLVFFSFKYLYEKKHLRYIVVMMCAIMFHKSAVIGFLLYPMVLLGQKNTRSIHIIIYIGSFFLSVVVGRYISQYAMYLSVLSKVESYVNHESSGGTLLTLLINCFNIFNFIYWNKLKNLNAANYLFLSIVSVGVCLWNIFLPLDFTLASRFSTFFILFDILIIPYYIYIWGNKKIVLARKLVTSFFISLFLGLMIHTALSIQNKPERTTCFPYQTIFYHHDYKNIHE